MKISIEDAKFLKSDDIKHKEVVTITTEGKWQESDTFKDEDGNPSREFRIDFKLPNGETRNTTLRSTNVKLIGKSLGTETKDWVGKELRAWKTKSEKAKAGFVFLFVPTDWERDDTGEWIGEQDNQSIDVKKEVKVDIDDIPFNSTPK